jgi:aminoglycoside phosphotransferase (APT) family kinase protein
MTAQKMHPDELDIDRSLVRRLLTRQFPQWADLPVRSVPSAGTENALFRLGDEIVVRLPRRPDSVGQVDKEHQWLPRFAPHLPLAIPLPLAKGTPSDDYPSVWSIQQWLNGENATLDRLAHPNQAAIKLAQFITALQGVDARDGPRPGAHNFFRGVPLAMRDAATRRAIADLWNMIDDETAIAVWEDALQTPAWQNPPVWIHGDLQSGNLLAVHGELTAVIDFGGLGVGDPACDLLVAWNLFSVESRAAFQDTLSVDEATWARGRGWALSFGLIALPYYLHSNPVLANIARYTINEVLADYKRKG